MRGVGLTLGKFSRASGTEGGRATCGTWASIWTSEISSSASSTVAEWSTPRACKPKVVGSSPGDLLRATFRGGSRCLALRLVALLGTSLGHVSCGLRAARGSQCEGAVCEMSHRNGPASPKSPTACDAAESPEAHWRGGQCASGDSTAGQSEAGHACDAAERPQAHWRGAPVRLWRLRRSPVRSKPLWPRRLRRGVQA